MSQAQYVVDSLKAELADIKVEIAVAKHTIAEQEAFIIENAPKLGLKVVEDEQGRKTLQPADEADADELAPAADKGAKRKAA